MAYNIGKVVEAERKRLGWDQAKLASMLGGQVRQQAISGWERGRSRPSKAIIYLLASIFDVEAETLLLNAGHVSKRSAMPRPVRPLVPHLPFEDLSPDQFEAFVADFLAHLHPGSEISRNGGQGHRQGGIDVLVVKDGRVQLGVQVKRERTFGPAKVREAVKEAIAIAETYSIYLARTASPQAREEIRRHSSWTLYDKDDLSRIVSQTLQRDSAVRLVDRYFPAWREEFLGVPNPGPWITTEDYFLPFSGGSLFSHEFELIGRTVTVGTLREFFATESILALIQGAGGSGKSRFLKEAARLAELENGFHVRFVAPASEVGPKDFELLRGIERLLVIVDDAHDRPHLGELIHGIRRVNVSARFILTSRPYARHQLASDVRRGGVELPDSLVWELGDLSFSDAELLVRQAAPNANDLVSIRWLASHCRDCPLIGVLGGRLLQSGRLTLGGSISGVEAINSILTDFLKSYLGNLADSERSIASRLMVAIALLQPVRLHAEGFVEALELLVGSSIDDIRPILRKLETLGALLRRGASFRVAPDVLGDALLKSGCFDEYRGTPSSLVKNAIETLNGTPLQHAFVNACKLDWMLSEEFGISSSVTAVLWEATKTQLVAAGFVQRSIILDPIVKVAIYVPDRALEIIRFVLDLPFTPSEEDLHLLGPEPSPQIVLDSVAKVLDVVSHRKDFAKEAVDLLWAIGKNDGRRLSHYPSHPIRILKRLADYEVGKPIDYTFGLIDAASRWLEEPSTLHSPLDVLSCVFATDGHNAIQDGHSLVFSAYAIIPAEALKARKAVVALAMKEAASDDVRRAAHAVRFLRAGTFYPHGVLGRHVSPEETAAWTPIILDQIEVLGKVSKISDADPCVHVAVREALTWHATYSSTETKAAARKVLDALPDGLMDRLALAIFDGWDRIALRGNPDHESAALEQRIWLAKTVKLLLENYSVSDLVQLIQSRLEAQNSAFPNEGNPEPFIRALLKAEPKVAEGVLKRITADPCNCLVGILSVVLSVEAETNIENAICVAEWLIELSNLEIARKVAEGLTRYRGGRMPAERELTILSKFAKADDEALRLYAIDSAKAIAHVDRSIGGALLSDVVLGSSNQVCHEFLEALGSHESLSWVDLPDAKREEVWQALETCESIADFGIIQFLVAQSEHDPVPVVRMLMRRVVRDDAPDRSPDFNALPLDQLSLAISDPTLRRHLVMEVIEWAARGFESWHGRQGASEIFNSLARPFDEDVLRVFNAVFERAQPELIATVGDFLREAPRDFVFENPDFVGRALRIGSQSGDEIFSRVNSGLYSSATSGVRSTIAGQPFPEDLRQRDRSQALMRCFTPGTVENDFYRKLYASATESLKAKALIDEQTGDFRTW